MAQAVIPSVKIRVSHVSRVFPAIGKRHEVIALQDVCLEVYDQEIVCVIGPSGCGKSTLLNTIAGFDQPTSGELMLHDHPIVNPGPDRSVVFQSPALFPWLNVIDNVEFGPKHRHEPKEITREKALKLLSAVKLSGWERHFVYELSGGMKQRVQLARALINDPEVLLMDEPFGPLDWQTRSEMQDLLHQVWEVFRPTIFLVTHDVEEAIILADRIYVFSRHPGRVVHQLEVKLPKPRNKEMITTSEFVEIKAELLHYLRGREQLLEAKAK